MKGRKESDGWDLEEEDSELLQGVQSKVIWA